ncbi:MAG: hypothetical protein JW993_04820 [Sedimentisphaerales bacterium]|nr:hypothetical protein [Sedimentisphaerales bacterium]
MYNRLVYLMVGALVVATTCSAFAAPEDLIAHWTFDEGDGTIAYDASGNGNDGTLGGGVTWVTGTLDGALQFDGSSGEVVAPHIAFDNRSFTIAMWINPVLTTDKMVFSQRTSDSTNLNLHIRVAGTGAAYAPVRGIRFGFYSNDLDTPTNILQDNTWYHVTFWYDYENQDRRIYLNGEQIAQASAGPFLGTSGNTIIGSWDTGEFFNGMIDDVQVYHNVLTDAEILSIMKGLADEGLASNPQPAAEAVDIPREAALSWTPGAFAATHNVYLGTEFDDVNSAGAGSPLLVATGQAANTYDPPGRLEFGQTYYWRVDEVNAPPTSSTVFKGEVWSFTVEPALYPIAGVTATFSVPTAEGSGDPVVTVDNSGLTDGTHGIANETMWSAEGVEGVPAWLQFDFDRVYKLYGMHVWNYNGLYEFILGFGLKDITIEYAVEPNQWMTLGDFQLARATNKPTYTGQLIDLDGLAASAIRITVNSTQSGGTQVGLSEIQFLQKPVFAREPEPADGATEVDRAALLDWRAGREAAVHQIHLGTDSNAVADGEALVDAVTAHPYNPGPLTLGTTYYWKVEEVNDVETPTAWDSDIWSFTVQEYVAIDNFEQYTDDEGSRIYEAWLDGYGSNDNGSQVGNDDPPYVQKTNPHGGAQAMPLYYHNTEGKAYSEAELAFASPQDWTANGADTFSLYYRGDPAAFLETSPGNIQMSGVGADIYQLTDEFRFAYKQLTGDGSITARVESVQNTNEWAKAGVMIRATLEPGAMEALMDATLRDRVEWIYRENAGTNITNANTDVNSTPLPQWVRVTRQGNTFTGEYSADGQTWLTIDATTPGTIPMPNTVYIGLVVCSHVADTPCVAEFSSVSMTGSVTGQWQLAAVGVQQPVGNDLDTFYLAVEDSSGKRVRMENPDPSAVYASQWTQWAIPLSDLTAAGLKVNSIKKLGLGVGDDTQASTGASGVMYIDDLAFGRPILTE